jgi:hypothetical protein
MTNSQSICKKSLANVPQCEEGFKYNDKKNDTLLLRDSAIRSLRSYSIAECCVTDTLFFQSLCEGHCSASPTLERHRLCFCASRSLSVLFFLHWQIELCESLGSSASSLEVRHQPKLRPLPSL